MVIKAMDNGGLKYNFNFFWVSLLDLKISLILKMLKINKLSQAVVWLMFTAATTSAYCCSAAAVSSLFRVVRPLLHSAAALRRGLQPRSSLQQRLDPCIGVKLWKPGP